MTTRTFAVVTAGLSQPSSTGLLADRLATATVAALNDRDVSATVEVVDLRTYAHDLTDNLLTGFPSPRLRTALDQVVGADGLVAVTPVFSASYSGLFKTFFDVLEPDALAGTPVLLGATAGSARHSLTLDHAMRPLFAYLRALVVPTGVFAAAEDWAAPESAGATALADRITRAAAELSGLMASMASMASVADREPQAPVDPFQTPTPFEQLLASG